MRPLPLALAAALLFGLSGCGSDEPAPEEQPQGQLIIVDGDADGEPTSRPAEPEPEPAPAPAPRPAPPPAPAPAPRPAPAPAAGGGKHVILATSGLEMTLEDAMTQIARQTRAQIVVDSRARDRKISLEGIDQAQTPWNVLVELLATRAKCRVQTTGSGILMIVPRR